MWKREKETENDNKITIKLSYCLRDNSQSFCKILDQMIYIFAFTYKFVDVHENHIQYYKDM